MSKNLLFKAGLQKSNFVDVEKLRRIEFLAVKTIFDQESSDPPWIMDASVP